MATIKEIKSDLRHREWAEQIQECQTSGQTVKEWCKGIGISPSTYYNRLRAVRVYTATKTAATRSQNRTLAA